MDNINPEYTRMIKQFPHEPLQFQSYTEEEMKRRSLDFYKMMDRRRSIRYFSSKPVDREILENAILTASTAPSGAHKQPWTYIIVQDPEIKKQIRLAAEAEEKVSYSGRMTEEWLNNLAPLGTTWEKPFIETVPYLIVVFKQKYGLKDGKKSKHYYVNESVGISVGILIAALHNAGLATLTHTPSPMGFLSKILNRPENESPFVLLPVGYPSEECTVPVLKRKPLDQVMKII